MKKFYVLSIIMLLSVAVFAQKQVGYNIVLPDQNLDSKAVTDTLFPDSFLTGTPTYYVTNYDNKGGFVVGTNGYYDEAKAQVFIVVGGYAIEGAIFWFAAKVQTAGTGVVDFNIYDMDGTGGTSTQGSGQTCPGTILGTTSLGIADIDTSLMLANAEVVTFTAPVYVNTDYAIGFDVADCYPDSLGLVSTTDGDAGQTELCWDLWAGGTDWYTFLEDANNWGLDFDLAVFPMVDMNAIGIEGTQWANGLKMSTYPNPAVNDVTLAYELQNDANNVRVIVTDVNGRTVENMNLGSQVAGVYNIQLDITDYASGTYYYMINASGNKTAIKMIVTK